MLDYRVHYKGEFTRAKILRIESGDAFSYDIQSGPHPIIASAEDFYAKDTAFCSLRSLQLKVPAAN